MGNFCENQTKILVEEHVQRYSRVHESCEKCQIYSGVRHQDELHPTFSPTINFKWMFDIVAMPTGIEQKKYLVLPQEDLTNQVEGQAL